MVGARAVRRIGQSNQIMVFLATVMIGSGTHTTRRYTAKLRYFLIASVVVLFGRRTGAAS